MRDFALKLKFHSTHQPVRGGFAGTNLVPKLRAPSPARPATPPSEISHVTTILHLICGVGLLTPWSVLRAGKMSEQSLKTAIEEQIQGKAPEDVLELVLDTLPVKKDDFAELEPYTELKSLTLNSCGLTSLEGFPAMPKLVRLELSDNLISEGLECLQDSSLVLLRSLSLANNKIATLDALEPLGSLPNLRDLDLFNCAVTETDNYRTEVFNMLPVLKYLDGFDIDDNEKEDEEDDDDGDESDLLNSEDGEEDYDEYEGEGEYDDSDGQFGEEGEAFGEDEIEEGEQYFDEGEEEYEGEADGFGEEDDDEDGDDGPTAKRAKR